MMMKGVVWDGSTIPAAQAPLWDNITRSECEQCRWRQVYRGSVDLQLYVPRSHHSFTALLKHDTTAEVDIMMEQFHLLH